MEYKLGLRHRFYIYFFSAVLLWNRMGWWSILIAQTFAIAQYYAARTKIHGFIWKGYLF